jgi:hypothetical protein
MLSTGAKAQSLNLGITSQVFYYCAYCHWQNVLNLIFLVFDTNMPRKNFKKFLPFFSFYIPAATAQLNHSTLG